MDHVAVVIVNTADGCMVAFAVVMVGVIAFMVMVVCRWWWWFV